MEPSDMERKDRAEAGLDIKEVKPIGGKITGECHFGFLDKDGKRIKSGKVTGDVTVSEEKKDAND